MCRPSVCQVEGCSRTKQVYHHRATGKYACRACRSQYERTGSFERPGLRRRKEMAGKIGECENCHEMRRLQEIREIGVFVCHGCRSAYSRVGYMPGLSRNTIERVLGHINCECGAPATRAIDLFGAAIMDVRKGAEWTTQRWMVFVCDECARAEHEIQHYQGWSEYRPTGYFNSREAGR